MTPARFRRALVALGIPAVACAPTPTASRQRGADHSAPAEDQMSADPVVVPTTSTGSAGPTTTTTEPGAPTTTAYIVVLPTVPPTTTTVRPRPLPTTTLPERVDDDATDAEWWAAQPGYVWGALADCESGGRNVDTGNGYSGFFQFSDATWRSMGTGYARAVDAPYVVQLAAARRLQARSGFGQWPSCARQLGLL